MRPFASIAVLALVAGCGPAATPPTVLSGGAPATSAAESACVSAAEGQTGRTGVTVAAAEPTATGTSVTLEVPGAAAPWTCVADQDGGVARVTYSGGESGA